jgi:hypothetical protein
MKNEDVLQYLLGAIEKKIPEKTKLVDILTEILFMEKGAVYRRLRGEVPFSFFEVVNIADKLDISLNSFIYTDTVTVDRFELNVVEYANMNEMDYKQWEDYNLLIESAKHDPDSEIAESSNILPVITYAQFDSLVRFYLFKYQYLLHGSQGRIPYCDVVFPERLQKIFRSYFYASQNIANTTFIWDYLIFRYLVNDVKFLYDIQLISADEVRQIKTDLFSLLDYVEQIALKGCLDKTGNPIDLYIADINLDADYSYIKINDLYMTHIRIFLLNSVASTDLSSYKNAKEWIQSLIKSSTLISQSGVKYRTDFLETQRKIIAEL